MSYTQLLDTEKWAGGDKDRMGIFCMGGHGQGRVDVEHFLSKDSILPK